MINKLREEEVIVCRFFNVQIFLVDWERNFYEWNVKGIVLMCSLGF